MASSYGAEDKIPWVSPLDIAAAIAEEIARPLTRHTVRYVASEELTCNEVASILGAAIGKPDLQWSLIADDQLQSSYEKFGMGKALAAGLVAHRAGRDRRPSRPGSWHTAAPRSSGPA